jgi:hypothetical protein
VGSEDSTTHLLTCEALGSRMVRPEPLWRALGARVTCWKSNEKILVTHCHEVAASFTSCDASLTSPPASLRPDLAWSAPPLFSRCSLPTVVEVPVQRQRCDRRNHEVANAELPKPWLSEVLLTRV